MNSSGDDEACFAVFSPAERGQEDEMPQREVMGPGKRRCLPGTLVLSLMNAGVVFLFGIRRSDIFSFRIHAVSAEL